MIPILVILCGMSMLLAAVASRIDSYIRILACQGFLLFLLAVSGLPGTHWYALLLPVIETLLFKTIIIPIILFRAVRRNGIYREVEADISNLYSLAAVSLIFLAGFLLAYWSVTSAPAISHLSFGSALSIIMSGLFLIMTRKKIITHILGFMMCENGMFLLSLSAGPEMPLLVNLGILLDIFIAIYLLVVFFNRISTEFDGVHIDQLTSLQD
jgi:hydrogenase-4 component E